MNGPATFRIFISSVSGELGSYRDEVARVLRRKGLEVKDQNHFRQGPATLLEQLRDYIKQCDAVILLVGDRCGAMATEEHAAALGANPVFEKYREETECDVASYTQWEFFLAKQHGKDLYVFFTDSGFIPDEPNTEDAALQARQAAYRRWVKKTGKARDPLITNAKLIEDVLVLPFPDLGRPKPIALPYASLGTLFKGREQFMENLRQSLQTTADGRATAISVKALHGLGGVGKSRLAVEYARRHVNDYSALLFVTADSPEALRRNLAALCGPLVLDLPEQSVPEEEPRLAAVLRWLGNNPGWLLILDSLDTQEAAAAAQEILANLQGGHVLLTGRLSNWGGHVVPLELDVLTVEAARDFLLARTQDRRRKTAEDDELAGKLAVELGQLALALEQAAAYISVQRLSFAGYLQQWQENRDKVLAWIDETLMQYPRSVAVTWQTSVDKLTPAARSLLQRLAWLSPDPIPESLLDVAVPRSPTLPSRDSSKASPTQESQATDPREALADLAAYSLVTRAADSPTFTIHRLVQDVTRRSLRDDPEHHALSEALGWIDAAFVGKPSDVRSWPTLDTLAPHARAAAQYADDVGITAPTARLLSDLGTLHLAKALHAGAEPLLRRALALTEQSYGAEDPRTAIQLNNLAGLLQATNRLAEAEPLLRRALALTKQSYGAEHPRTAIQLNNLAQLLQDTNRLAEAEPLMRDALAIDEKSYRAEHPDVARDLNNLARLLHDTDRLTEAETMYRRALAIDEQSCGAEHPKVAIRLNNLAVLLVDTNRLAEAEPLMRRALSIFSARLGDQHPKTVGARGNLDGLLTAMGKEEEEA